MSKPVAVQVTSQPLPELRVIGLAVPSRMQAGDTIDPTIVLENFGTADSGPVTVDLVESVTKSFTLGSSIIASYTVSNVPGGFGVAHREETTRRSPSKSSVSRKTSSVSPAACSRCRRAPKHYYLGVVVDPNGAIKQLSQPSECAAGDPRRRSHRSGTCRRPASSRPRTRGSSPPRRAV